MRRGVPATPSPRPSPPPHARNKKARRCTGGGLLLYSLGTLLGELATRCRNTCRVRSDPEAPPFTLLTQPTDIQRRVAELIGMFPVPAPLES